MLVSSQFITVYYNLLKACIGAGILSYPMIFQKYGILPTILFTITSACVSLFGGLIYINLNNKYGKDHTMATLSKHMFPSLKNFVSIVIIIKCYITSLIYFNIVKDIIRSICDESQLSMLKKITPNGISNGVLFLISLFLTPFVCASKLGALKNLSILGMIGIFILMIGCFSISSGHSSKVRLATGDYDFIESIGLFVFGFNCHQNIFAVHNESHVSVMKFRLYMISVFISATIIYLIFGFMNYSSFGNITGNILTSWPKSLTKRLVVVAYAAIIAVNAPLQLQPTKDSIVDLIGDEYISRHNVGVLLVCSIYIIVYFNLVTFDIFVKLVSSSLSTFICFGFPAIYIFCDAGKKSVYDIVMGICCCIFSLLCFRSFYITMKSVV